MSEFQIAANPFGMMINPEAVIDAMNRSDRLERLQRRVYRPLDKPMIPKSGEASGEANVDEPTTEFAQSGEVGAGVSQVMAPDMSDVIAISPPKLAY